MRRRAGTTARNDGGAEEIRAHGRLPHADIDIVYRRSRENDAEFIAINVRTIPMSQTFERLLAMSNPFYFWTQMVEAAWRPWLRGLHTISSQATPGRLRPPADD